MSNQMVGNVYHTIIEDVVNSSRVDFEESGVEESVLELLRVGWQHKLSQLEVARFPWDPKPEPPSQPPSGAPPPAVPVSAPTQEAHFSPALNLPQSTTPVPLPQNGIKQEPGLEQSDVHIKQEPGNSQGAAALLSTYNSMENKNSVAASRAAQQLQAQYGIRAAGSINALQAQGQPPNVGQQQQRNGQTDGAGDEDEADYEGVLMRQSPQGDVSELGRVEIDRMLHDQIAAKAKEMEGGGLMLPLQEAARGQKAKSLRSKDKGKQRAEPSVGMYDGGDDDDAEEYDEDAINSDLDDPEDDVNEDDVEDDGGLGHIMLCMYDKVQRVKNKWKCTLKDGVLTVNGKEYVFNKATGEYEW